MAKSTSLMSTNDVEQAFPKGSQKEAGVYFDAKNLGSKIENRYVAWIDLMGAGGIMGRSLNRAANYIGKIHGAVITSVRNGVEIVPVIDGCYVLSEEREPLEQVMSESMCKLATVFVHESSNDKRFLVRGGVAAGRVIAGRHLVDCSDTLKKHADYAKCIAIGTAVGQAYEAEKLAPPYGFWVDITARSFKQGSSQPFTKTMWRWWTGNRKSGEKQREILGSALDAYFEWAAHNHRALEYDLKRLDEHRSAAKEYFSMDDEE